MQLEFGAEIYNTKKDSLPIKLVNIANQILQMFQAVEELWGPLVEPNRPREFYILIIASGVRGGGRGAGLERGQVSGIGADKQTLSYNCG